MLIVPGLNETGNVFLIGLLGRIPLVGGFLLMGELKAERHNRLRMNGIPIGIRDGVFGMSDPGIEDRRRHDLKKGANALVKDSVGIAQAGFQLVVESAGGNPSAGHHLRSVFNRQRLGPLREHLGQFNRECADRVTRQ